MKRFLSFLAISLFLSVASQAQTVIPSSDELVLPQFAINGTTTASRLQYVCRLKLTGLNPSATYRYFTGASNNAALTGTAPGNHFAINNNIDPNFGYITGYTSSKSMSGLVLTNDSVVTTGRYSEFTTNAAGEYVGWFSFVPTGNAAFTAGNDVYVYVELNNGSGGTTVATRYRTTSTVKILGYATSSGPNNATALVGASFASPETFVMIYDNSAGTGRPLYGTWVESDGILTAHTTWYGPNVEGINGNWGAIIPNDLSTGVRRIENLDINSNVVAFSTDSDGVWPSGANTVNPLGGTTPIVISNADASLPVELSSFNSRLTNRGVELTWSTATETNNAGFEIERSNGNIGWTKLSFVKGNGTTTESKSYSFTDASATGRVSYRLKQVDFDGKFEYSSIIEVDAGMPRSFDLSQNYPNPFNPSTTIAIQLPVASEVKLEVFDLLGRKVATLLNGKMEAGRYSPVFEGSNLSSGVYLYRLQAGSFVSTKKMMLVK